MSREIMRLEQEFNTNHDQLMESRRNEEALRMDYQRADRIAKEANNPSITQSKVNELNKLIEDLSDERDNLEKKYFSARQDYMGALDMREHYQLKAEHN
jgi:hypothetical protein